MKTITAAQHLALTYSSRAPGMVPTWAKEGETQAAALKRDAAARKRAASAKEKRQFPAFKPGETTVIEYVKNYYHFNGLGDNLAFFAPLSDNPQGLFDDSVMYSEADEDARALAADMPASDPDNARRFDIIAINEKSGEKTRFYMAPMTHAEACTILEKHTQHAGRRLELLEITAPPVDPLADEYAEYLASLAAPGLQAAA